MLFCDAVKTGSVTTIIAKYITKPARHRDAKSRSLPENQSAPTYFTVSILPADTFKFFDEFCGLLENALFPE